MFNRQYEPPKNNICYYFEGTVSQMNWHGACTQPGSAQIDQPSFDLQKTTDESEPMLAKYYKIPDKQTLTKFSYNDSVESCFA